MKLISSLLLIIVLALPDSSSCDVVLGSRDDGGETGETGDTGETDEIDETGAPDETGETGDADPCEIDPDACGCAATTAWEPVLASDIDIEGTQQLDGMPVARLLVGRVAVDLGTRVAGRLHAGDPQRPDGVLLVERELAGHAAHLLAVVTHHMYSAGAT